MKIESVFAAVIILFLILKYLEVPGSNMILVLAMFSLSFMYLLIAFYLFCDKKLANQNLAFSIFSGISLAIAPLGVLYKLMIWDGGQRLILSGSLISIVILVIAYFLKSKAQDNLKIYYDNMILRTAILTLVSLVLYITPAKTLLNMEYPNDPELVRLKSLNYEIGRAHV